MATTQTLSLPQAAAPRARGLGEDAARRLAENRLALAGLAVVLVFIAVAILAPIIAPYNPGEQDLTHTFSKPSSTHLMGTDNLGRDWFSRLLYGARLSIAVGFFAQAVVLAIGIPVGTLAGYFGGQVDNVLMRFADLMYAFPTLLFIILLRTVFGGSLFSLFFIIGLTHWMSDARLVRGQILSLKERDFVLAAKSLGSPGLGVMWRHLFPNTLGPIIVVVAFGVPRAIFTEATLSFIGVGAKPSTPSWGSMIHEGYSAVFAYPHLVIFPAIAIALLMLSFTFLGDGLRDALDPRMR